MSDKSKNGVPGCAVDSRNGDIGQHLVRNMHIDAHNMYTTKRANTLMNLAGQQAAQHLTGPMDRSFKAFDKRFGGKPLGSLFAPFKGALGSGGEGAPQYGGFAGPVTGTLLQGALLSLLGGYAGKGIGHLIGDERDARRN